ncbi:MAG TPA: hypothetical protein VE991_05180, partial [Acidimicrobiales bacterium]|nr:hypothetical protein [Acidimicrobiales bacterium]
NEAARLSELTKGSPARALTSAGTLEAARADERAHWEPAGTAVLRGRDRPTVLYALVREDRRRSGDQPPATAGTIETV